MKTVRNCRQVVANFLAQSESGENECKCGNLFVVGDILGAGDLPDFPDRTIAWWFDENAVVVDDAVNPRVADPVRAIAPDFAIEVIAA